MGEKWKEENEGEVNLKMRKKKNAETFRRLAGGIGGRGGVRSRDEGRGEEGRESAISRSTLSTH